MTIEILNTILTIRRRHPGVAIALLPEQRSAFKQALLDCGSGELAGPPPAVPSKHTGPIVLLDGSTLDAVDVEVLGIFNGATIVLAPLGELLGRWTQRLSEGRRNGMPATSWIGAPLEASILLGTIRAVGGAIEQGPGTAPAQTAGPLTYLGRFNGVELFEAADGVFLGDHYDIRNEFDDTISDLLELADDIENNIDRAVEPEAARQNIVLFQRAAALCADRERLEAEVQQLRRVEAEMQEAIADGEARFRQSEEVWRQRMIDRDRVIDELRRDLALALAPCGAVRG